MITTLSSLFSNTLYSLLRPDLLLLTSRSKTLPTTSSFATGFTTGISTHNMQSKRSCREEVAVQRYTLRAAACQEKKFALRKPLSLAGSMFRENCREHLQSQQLTK